MWGESSTVNILHWSVLSGTPQQRHVQTERGTCSIAVLPFALLRVLGIPHELSARYSREREAARGS